MPAPIQKSIHYSVYIGFAMALAATMASLYLSEVRHLPPCVLCWYQRICMYPLVLLFGAGILRRERALYQYILPLAGIGWIIALYHSLIQWKLISDTLSPCVQGVSCTTVQINLLGFITIPFMSLTAFSIIIVSMLILVRHERKSRI
jgi:disulfide bond formation protein DsbB